MMRFLIALLALLCLGALLDGTPSARLVAALFTGADRHGLLLAAAVLAATGAWLIRVGGRGRYAGQHRPGTITPWMPPPVDPWAAGEALDTLVDTRIMAAAR
jgi:hypothetical protein